jgi:hypothetical protein
MESWIFDDLNIGPTIEEADPSEFGPPFVDEEFPAFTV